MSTIKDALKKQREQAAAEKAKAEKATGEVEKTETDVSASTTPPLSDDQHSNKPFVELPVDKLDAQGYVSLSGQRKQINEEFRSIKQKVLNNAFGPMSSALDSSNLIMVTSAMPGEGKSFCSINLALSIALEQDKTVLLVDCDVLKPSLHKKLDIAPEKGLIEYLTGEVDDVADIIHRTNVDKLRFITAGQQHHLSTELLASQRMADLASEFVNRYPDRIVIMDCPPLLGINETTVLSSLAGQILIVTVEGVSKMGAVKSAVAPLDKNKAIGFVMNKATKAQNSQYGYGYGYGYGAN